MAPDRCTSAGSTLEKAGTLSFSSVTMRSATLGPTPGVRATAALTRSATPFARLDSLAPTHPCALDVAGNPEQFYLVFAHISLRPQHRGSPPYRERLQRP